MSSLPDRRMNSTVKIDHAGQSYFLTLGIDHRDKKVKEVFGNARRLSSDLDYLVSDSCIMISIALREGSDPALLLKSMSFVPVIGSETETQKPASLIGLILVEIMKEQARIDDIYGQDT